MKSIRWMSTVVVLAALALPAAAENWKLGTSRECGTAGNALKCLLNKSFHGDTAVLVVTTKLPNVSFTYSSWHSTCGFPGGNVESTAFRENETGRAIAIDVLDAGRGITCREIYVSDCKANDAAIACSAAVSAVAQTFVGNRQ